MRKFLVATVATLTLSAPVLAQTPESTITGRQSTFSITPYAGYMFFGSLADISDDAHLSNDDNWIVGAQAQVRMTSRWSVLGNFAYSKTKTTVEFDDGTTIPTSGDIGYWLADADLQYQLPMSWNEGKVAPFIQGGIGMVRYTADFDDINAEDSNTDLQFNAGVGLDIDRGPVGFQIMLKDYVTSLDWNEFGDFQDQIPDDIDSSRIANNLALTAGLRIHF
ncbi:MAG TPA: outer membrane beta-barrel protein [Gemmatimonadaceae bacterium]|nr:outer membrane beta-barrel protein [Gemmatimonadaceae bacterium]